MKTVPPYTIFPQIYDACMNHVPYHRWGRYLLDRAAEHFSFPPRSVLDLACGTGLILAELRGSVREVFGVDQSGAMLDQARLRVPSATFQEARLQGPLPFDDGAIAWAVSTHDSVNYLTDPAAVAEHFGEVARVLETNGLYSMDVVSLENILENFHRKKLEERVGNTHLVWTNEYDAKTRVMVSRLVFRPGRGETLLEIHEQRYYDEEELLSMAGAHGLRLRWHENDYSAGRVRGPSHMINFHFYKHG